jgi:predicted nucleotidyltransferase
MSIIFNTDFKDLISSLNKFDVEYVLVGGYAVILHGYQRTTADIDLWVNRTEDNYFKLMKAFLDFGLPTTAVPKADFLYNPDIEVYRFGIDPSAVDIIIQMKGMPFEEAYSNAKVMEMSDGLRVRLVHLKQLIELKKLANRARDINDLENLPPLQE